MSEVDWRIHCGVWDQPHSSGVILSSESGGLTDVKPVLQLMENLVLAFRTPGKLADLKKNSFFFPSSHSSCTRPWESFRFLDAFLFTQLQRCLLGRFLSGLFLSNSWRSFPKNNVYFVVSWKCPWGIHLCKEIWTPGWFLWPTNHGRGSSGEKKERKKERVQARTSRMPGIQQSLHW